MCSSIYNFSCFDAAHATSDAGLPMQPDELTEAVTPALLAALSDEQLALLEAKCRSERQRRTGGTSAAAASSSSAPSQTSGTKRKAEEPASAPPPDGSIVELVTINDRLKFAHEHGLEFEQGIQDTIEEDLDCFGIPERFAMVPPPGFKPYRRQKPGIEFFPSDREAVYVVSERAFGAVPE